jgi:hypothetical protein
MRGCGFFIKPRLVITCSHIIGRDAESGTEIKLYKWNSRINCLHGARLFKNFPKDDIAFIETRDCNPTYAPLSDDGAQLWHPLIAIGFPQNGNAFDSCSGIYESNTPWCDNENDDVITYTKFKDCQIEEGYSGGPLLNLRTHKVMGVVNWTRNHTNNTGGWAIQIPRIEMLMSQCNIKKPEIQESWETAVKAGICKEQASLRTQHRVQVNRVKQLGNSGLYLMIQFPLIDLRPLLGRTKLNVPRWSSMPIVNQEFVHFFGEIRQRSKSIPGDLPWNDELFYATARRAVTFPQLEKKHIGRFRAPQGGLRALYHDKNSGVVERVEVGITIRPGQNEVLESADFFAILHDFLSLPSDIAHLNSAESNGDKRERVRHVIRKPLISAGSPLARLYENASSQIGVLAETEAVCSRSPVAFVLYKGHELEEPNEQLVIVDRKLVNNATVHYATYKSHNRLIGVWFIDVSSASSYAIRRLRIGLSRLHAERAALVEVINSYNAKKLDACPELVMFLETRHAWLSGKSKFGIDILAIQDIATAHRLEFPEEDLGDLGKRIGEIRNAVANA